MLRAVAGWQCRSTGWPPPPSSAYDPTQVPWPGGGWLTRLVSLRPRPPVGHPAVRAGWRHQTPRRSARMLSAYVLILTEVGKVAHVAHVAHVAQALSDLDGVQVAEDITGPLRHHRQDPGAQLGSA